MDHYSCSNWSKRTWLELRKIYQYLIRYMYLVYVYIKCYSFDIILLSKVHLVKVVVFPGVRLQMWELDHGESIVPKDSGECPGLQGDKSVNPKGNQPWIFTGRTDAEAPVLWPPDAKSWLIGRDPDAGKDGGKEEKGTTEDKMIGWHHWINGQHEFEQTLGDSEGQGSLVCYSPRGCKEADVN